MRRRTDRERGVAMVLSAIWLTAIIAFAAIAIEVSRLTDTATEVQVAADAAALAAAQNMVSTGNTGTATTAARTVAAQNRTDGHAPASGDINVVFGNYSIGSGFTGGGAPQNAVRATVTIGGVQYLLASALGLGTSTSVNKRAVATYQCTGAGEPTAPIAICDCALTQYTQGQQCSGGGHTFTQSPNPAQNSCWTDGPSGAHDWFPPECGGGNAPFISVGDSVGLSNGQMTPILRDFQSCINTGGTDQGIHDYTVLVIHCTSSPSCTIGNCNHSATVVGFASIHINHSTDVQPQGGNKGITYSQICNNNAPGTGGITGGGAAACFGSGNVKLVDDR